MPITEFNVNFIVATSAKTHQVAFVVCPASIDGQDVMNFLNRRCPPFRKASFTKRVLSHIPCPDTLPFRSVLLGVVGRALVLIVLLLCLLPMLFAISPVRKVRTVRIGTGFLWFVRHTHPPPQCSVHRKRPTSCSPVSLLFHDTIIALLNVCSK